MWEEARNIADVQVSRANSSCFSYSIWNTEATLGAGKGRNCAVLGGGNLVTILEDGGLMLTHRGLWNKTESNKAGCRLGGMKYALSFTENIATAKLYQIKLAMTNMILIFPKKYGYH